MKPRPDHYYTGWELDHDTLMSALRGHLRSTEEPVVLSEEIVATNVHRFKVKYGTVTTMVNVGGAFNDPAREEEAYAWQA